MSAPRLSGLLLSVPSLPSPFGIGDLGPGTYAFVDFLAASEQRVWQVLPLVPVGHGNSPYAGLSTFAGNPLLVSPESLRRAGLLADDDLAAPPSFPPAAVDYAAAEAYKTTLLRRAFARFEARPALLDEPAFFFFCQNQADWLDDYALFMALKEAHDGAAWTAWPRPLVRREPGALEHARRTLAREVRYHQFVQFVFAEQWRALKAYANRHGIRIFGDLPIYVAHDSADVWGHQDLFFLDDDGQPTVVAGVPPDYFSETGQRWGNPLYRWDRMQQQGFPWWTRRLEAALRQVDILRLDHFRGFGAYWEIPADEETAVRGRWVPAPGAALFETARQRLGKLPVVAENLGIITPDVVALMEHFDFPGMAVLQFAFDSDTRSGFLPHHYTRNLVAYTGTHDNDTMMGWWKKPPPSQPPDEAVRARRFAHAYLHLEGVPEAELPWAFVRAIMASVAQLALFPVQDVLGLGSEARLNTPGSDRGNWAWRLPEGALDVALARRLRHLTCLYGRGAAPYP